MSSISAGLKPWCRDSCIGAERHQDERDNNDDFSGSVHNEFLVELKVQVVPRRPGPILPE
jgi:hypothetical protein